MRRMPQLPHLERPHAPSSRRQRPPWVSDPLPALLVLLLLLGRRHRVEAPAAAASPPAALLAACDAVDCRPCC
jgi:hypothetical protein